MKLFIHINCACSIDGKIALPDGRQYKLSNEWDLERVLNLRAKYDGILIGIGTVLKDDPHLTTKGRGKNPTRIVLDTMCRTPEDALVVNNESSTIIFCEKPRKNYGENVKVVEVPCERVNNKKYLKLEVVLSEIYNLGIRSLLVEGGSEVLWSFLSTENFDIFTMFMRFVIIGGKGPTVASGYGFVDGACLNLRMSKYKIFDEGMYMEFRRS